MRRHGCSWILRGVVAATLALPMVAGATAAQAATTGTPLPSASFFKLLVDDAHRSEFVSGGPSTTGLAMLDTTGSLVHTLTMQGPSGMVLVGSKLFIAEADGPDIAVLDTTVDPPAVLARYDIGALTQPRDLAYAGGRLWFISATGLASINLDGGDLYGPFQLNLSPGVRFVQGIDGGDELLFNDGTNLLHASATVPPRTVFTTSNGGGSATLVPGGADVIGTNYSTGFVESRLCDGATLRTYTGSNYAVAVAVTTAHGGLVAGGSSDSYGNDLFVFRLALAANLFTYDFGTEDDLVASYGVAWSADGDSLFVVTDGPLTTPTFHVVAPTGLPDLQWPTLTVTPSPSPVDFGSTTDVAVHLVGGDTNHDVKLFSQPVGGTRTLVASGTVDGSGDLMVPGFLPPSSTTLTATYDGDAGWGIATTAVSLDVRSRTTQHLRGGIGSKNGVVLYNEGTQVQVVAHVFPAAPDGPAVVKVERNRGSGWRPVWSQAYTYDAAGAIRVNVDRLPARGRYRIRVVSRRTATYLASSSDWQRFRFM